MKINASGYVRFKNNLDYKTSNILVHGPDGNIINDTTDDIIENLKKRHPDINIKNYTADQIAEDPSLLMDQMDLFSSNNDFDIFVIADLKDKHLKLFSDSIENTPENRSYIFKGPGLNTRSKFVKLFADSKTDYVLGVYDVNISAIRDFCIETFKEHNLIIDQQNALLLIDYLGYDRKLINSSIEKIFLYYFAEKKLDTEKSYISFEECKNVISSKSSDELDNLIKAIIGGNITKIPNLYEKTINAGNDYILVLRSLNYRFNRLLQVSNAIDMGENLDGISTKLSPPIFFKEKDEIKNNLKTWNKYKLSKAIDLLYDAELYIKTGKSNVHNNTMRSFLNIAKVASLRQNNKIAA